MLFTRWSSPPPPLHTVCFSMSWVTTSHHCARVALSLSLCLNPGLADPRQTEASLCVRLEFHTFLLPTVHSTVYTLQHFYQLQHMLSHWLHTPLYSHETGIPVHMSVFPVPCSNSWRKNTAKRTYSSGKRRGSSQRKPSRCLPSSCRRRPRRFTTSISLPPPHTLSMSTIEP